MKRIISIIVASIAVALCYKFNQRELGLGIGMYVMGCISIVLFQMIFHKSVTEFEANFDTEFNSYEDFIDSSDDTLWNKFVEEADVDVDFTSLSDDRKMFYEENIEKYSNLLDKQLKQNTTNLLKIIGTNL